MFTYYNDNLCTDVDATFVFIIERLSWTILVHKLHISQVKNYVSLISEFKFFFIYGIFYILGDI